ASTKANANANANTKSNGSSRVSSRSASPCRRERANSLTPAQDSISPLPLRKRPPRPTTQLNEIFRPRCNTDPSRVGNGKKPLTVTRSVLGSLLRQTLKVTSASVGLSASEER
ncbi:hypothetical protein KR044_003757, partial [Drosophila immigrans]